MAEHNDLGILGERLALEYLVEQEFEIIANNYRFEKAEIDIIAKKDGLIVFIEVKSRTSLEYGSLENFVSQKQQHQIIHAAQGYITSNNVDLEARFDIITVLVNNNSHKIEHISAAFYPT